MIADSVNRNIEFLVYDNSPHYFGNSPTITETGTLPSANSTNSADELKFLLSDGGEQCSLRKMDSARNGSNGENNNEDSMDEPALIIDLTIDDDEQRSNGTSLSAIDQCDIGIGGTLVETCSKGSENPDSVVIASASANVDDEPSTSSAVILGIRRSVDSSVLRGYESSCPFPPYGVDVNEAKPVKISRYTQVYPCDLEPIKSRKKSPSKVIESFKRLTTIALNSPSDFNLPTYIRSQSTSMSSFKSSTLRSMKNQTASTAGGFKWKSRNADRSLSSTFGQDAVPVDNHRPGKTSLLALLPSGCSRHTPYSGIRKTRNWFHFLLHPDRSHLRVQGGGSASAIRENSKRRRCPPLAASHTVQYEWLRQHPVAIRLGKSRIHGVGVFANEDIAAGQFIVEYKGELIRNTLVDRREKFYRSKGIGSYMFKLDGSFTIDGTMKGGAARFINHSCVPNCTAKVVRCESNNKHIILLASKKISKGDELCYDYKLPKEREKIPCLCYSSSCRKSLN